MSPEPRDSELPKDAVDASAPTPRIPEYELLRRIGEGGYGEVWLARGLTGVYCAVKIVRRDRFAADEPFQREFRGLKESMTGRGGSSGGMALLHVGQNDAERYFYYVMELADDAERGRAINPASYVPLTLRELRRRRGRVTADECVQLCLPAVRELAALHARGLVHRDIKPSNLIVVGGEAKLADIGLVSRAAEALTFVGTEGFVPPEGPGSPAADVWALGKVLYELSTGFERDEFPKLPENLGNSREQARLFALNRIWLHACDPDAKNRYANGTELLEALEAFAAGRSPRRKWRPLHAATAAALAVALTFGIFLALRGPAPPPAEPAHLPSVIPKSIAVLPFENRSDDKTNDYLADGIQEDVLTNLAGIGGLKVVSQASAMRYRGSAASTRQIGAELGVAFILYGSLRREGNMIRLTARLVDARSDEQVWARNFDREISGILALQSALAGEIAPALHLALNPEEKAALARNPTESLSAYELFHQGRKIRRDSGDLEGVEKAEELLKRAVAEDPNFVRAWAELAAVRIDILAMKGERQSPAQVVQIQEAIDAAQRLAPNSPEVLLVLGRMRYTCFNDNGGAMFYYQKILAERPNYPEVHEALALVYRKQGRWGDVVRELRTAWRLEPGNRWIAGSLKWTLRWMHRYDEADEVLREQLRLWPEDPDLRSDMTMPPFRSRGSRREFEEWLAGLTPEERESPKNIENRISWASLTGDIPMLLDLVKVHGVSLEEVDALVAVFRSGQEELGRSLLEKLKPEIDRRLAANPLNSDAWLFLAKYHALRGDEPAALKAVDQVRKLVPDGSHALIVASAHRGIAHVLGWLGRNDEAIAMVERLVKQPGFVHVWNLRSSVAWLPLRDDPRLKAIIDDPRNSEPLLVDEPAVGLTGGTPDVAVSKVTRRLAVLPFESLSDEREDSGFFAEGVHDELITNLGFLRGLSVVSRARVLPYKGSSIRLADIARELDANYILTGSVRRSGSRMRITARLVDTSRDEQIWTRSFDRELGDVFTLQSELAEAIAGGLQVALSPDEMSLIDRHPTSVTAAYDLYLQARQIRYSTDLPYPTPEAEKLLSRAVELDPGFAAAWAEIGFLNAFKYFSGEDATGTLLAAATAAIDKAVALAPDDPVVMRCRGDYYYYARRDYERAASEYQRLLQILPNDGDVRFALANVRRRQGLWSSALVEHRRACELEPNRPRFQSAYFTTLVGLRRYDEAEAVSRGWASARPRNLWLHKLFATAVFRQRGAAVVEAADLPDGDIDPIPAEDALDCRVDLAALRGDWQTFIRLRRAQLTTASDRDQGRLQVMMALGIAESGDVTAAEEEAKAAVVSLRPLTEARPGDSGTMLNLAMALAIAGNRSEAVRWADRALESVTAHKDAFATPAVASRRACVLAWAGETERALAEVARLLREPFGVCVSQARHYESGLLSFLPLRGDPRFEALLADPLNNEPLL